MTTADPFVPVRNRLTAMIAAIIASGGMTLAISPAVAQTAETPSSTQAPADEATEEEAIRLETVGVVGLRQTIQSSIATKRNATAIVDAISSSEIGGIPATSIGEAIETITGASTHREKGGATEIAIRGLGPFLGGATFNGREASNGSGDRSVNFNQFPSELINAITIYKTQQANLIEGSVSGQIELQTLRPLDYGKRLLQVEAEANQNEYQSRINGGDDFGWRGTVSYVDQFKIGEGELGISVGLQRNDTNNPEEVYSGSTTWRACDPSIVRPTSNCSEIDRADVRDGAPFYIVPNSRTFRQISEEDRRDASFAAIQYRPNDEWEFNLDFQKSRRQFNETRQDLNFSEGRRGITNPLIGANGLLLAYDGESSIETTAVDRVQSEDYRGFGFNVSWEAADNLTLTADLSVSETTRVQIDRAVRLRSDSRDIFNETTPLGNQRVPYSYDARNGDVPTFTIDPRFDVTNWDLFSDDARLRRDEQLRNNKIRAFRFDATYVPESEFFTAIDVGLRLSNIQYNDYDDRNEFTQGDRDVDRDANLACRIDFPQDNFLDNDSGNSVSTWATFDPVCLYRQYLGTEDPGRNDDLRAINNNDVEESTESVYLMASFETALGDTPVRGNFGVRAVDTSVTSTGLRADIDVVQNNDGTISLDEVGEFSAFQIKNSYSRVLPSANVIFDFREDLIFRVGLFRAMSRPDLSDLGAGRSIDLADGEAFADLGEAIEEISASGSPTLKPLMSWNYDFSAEWYPNPDSILSAAIYYKSFEGGFSNAVIDETFVIDGEEAIVPVVQAQNSGRTSSIHGLELTAAYRFSKLPQPFDGLGFKIGYNYAKSDFETEDLRLGDLVDPFTGEIDEGIIPPADIFGLSEHVGSAQLFWEIGKLELQAIYKLRTNYYQKFVGSARQLRYVDDVETVDLRASYDFNKHVSLQIEAINVFDEPKVTYMPVQGQIREFNTYGARYYAGIRVKF